MVKEWENIEKWLSGNGYGYRKEAYGSDYFGDGFRVDGIRVTFPADGGMSGRMKHLEKYMERKTGFTMRCIPYGNGYVYDIFTAEDKKKLDDHEAEVKAATDKFWEREHMRRVQAGNTTRP